MTTRTDPANGHKTQKQAKKALAPWTARLGAAIALSSSIVLGQGLIQNTRAAEAPDDTARLTEAYSVAFNRAACVKANAPLIAHIEDVSDLLARESGDDRPEFMKHAQVAAEILWDRVNAGHGGDCLPVRLMDIPSYDGSMALQTLLRHFQVLTASDGISWMSDQTATALAKGQPTDGTSPSPAFAELQQHRAAFGATATFSPNFWETQSDAVVVIAAGNDSDEQPTLKENYFIPIYNSDGLIMTGALDTHSHVADYSSYNAPDLVWYTGFAQGFCAKAYATRAEIMNFERVYNKKIAATPSPEAGKSVCDEDGDSFSAPDVGGFVARGRAAFPALSSEEVATAAYLAATSRVRAPGRFIVNARGNAFNAASAGHGAFLPKVFDRLLQRLNDWKGAGHSAHIERLNAQAQARHNRAVLHFDRDLTLTRTGGTLIFAPRRHIDAGNLPAHIPNQIELISPAGTHFHVPLWLDSTQYDGQVRARFTNSAFLGEHLKGDWIVKAPPHYILESAHLTQVGADPVAGNTIDWLIDDAQAYKAAHPNEMKLRMDRTPWRHVPVPTPRPAGL